LFLEFGGIDGIFILGHVDNCFFEGDAMNQPFISSFCVWLSSLSILLTYAKASLLFLTCVASLSRAFRSSLCAFQFQPQAVRSPALVWDE
jgi:hypothetical protein